MPKYTLPFCRTVNTQCAPAVIVLRVGRAQRGVDSGRTEEDEEHGVAARRCSPQLYICVCVCVLIKHQLNAISRTLTRDIPVASMRK